jgi:hypothetical protein
MTSANAAALHFASSKEAAKKRLQKLAAHAPPKKEHLQLIASQLRDGGWIYKISISEDPRKPETFDNWIAITLPLTHKAGGCPAKSLGSA